MSNRYDDLALHLKLDDIDISKDSSKFHCTAVVQGGSLAEDDTFGACLNFGGQNDRFEVNGVMITGLNPAHTIEAWIKVGAYPQARCSIVQLGSGSNSHHWLLNAEHADGGMGGKAQLGVWSGKQFTTPIVPVAEWVHIAATYDGSNLVCYLNGQPIDKPEAAAFNLSNPHSKQLELAKRASGSKEGNFQGKMAHVRIYRRALSEVEIREDMDTDRIPVRKRPVPGSPAILDDLVLHLNLDDIDISTKTITTPDSSKSGHKAIVQGASLVADDTFGACLNLDGQDDYVEVSTLGLWNEVWKNLGTSATLIYDLLHTIEGWIKVEAHPQSVSWMLRLGGEPGSDPMSRALIWMVVPDGKLAVLVSGVPLHLPVVPLGEWVHIATSFDGNGFVGYLNGQPLVNLGVPFFNPPDTRLTLAKSFGPEKSFQGKMAHVRVYRRALSMAEIREDMETDKLALPEYRRGHPIGFSLSDKDENYVLYIGDDPRDHHHLNLELRNTSSEVISFQKQGDTASRDNHHFELVFRNGVLSDKTLKMLRENKDKDKIVPEKDAGAWDVFSAGEDNFSGTISVYFLYKDTSKPFDPGQRLVVPLQKISANAGAGARGTRIELKLKQLTYVGETTPITGSRIQHLKIISHLGSQRLPLHVSFVGSNRILNDGVSANTLVLQLMNVIKSEGDTSVTLKKETEFLISFDVESSKEVAPWSLCTEEEIKGLKQNDIIVAKIDQNNNVEVDGRGKPVPDTGMWNVERTGRRQGFGSPVWSLSPKQDIVLKHDQYILVYISNIITSLPSGLTNLYLNYQRIPGFWDGQVVCPIEKAPLLFYDVKDQQGKYTGELRVGIGCVKPQAKLEIAIADNDADTRPLVIRKDKVYLTVLKDGNVGIGKEEPNALLDVNGEIRANFFRAGEGHSKRLPVGKTPVGTPSVEGPTVWDEDIKWYRIAKIALPEFALAGAKFSLRASVAGKTSQVLVFQLVSSTRSRLMKRPFARFTVLSNTCSRVFSKARIVSDAQDSGLEILTRWDSQGEIDVSFSIEDNLDISPWQPIAWEERPADVPGTALACEYNLENHQFLVADAMERFSVTSNGDVLINSKVGIGTGSPGAKLSIIGGLHVGGESDPGDKNLVVGGKASIEGGLHVGAALDGHEGLSTDSGLLVNGSGFFLGSLLARNSIGLLHTGTKDLVAEIAVEPALVFKTHHGAKWRNSLTVQPPGGHEPTLAVAGYISEQLDVIETKGLTDWTAGNQAIMKYFSGRLSAKPPGTMLRAITDHRDWKGYYWKGWVDADGKIRVIHNHHNTQYIAPQD